MVQNLHSRLIQHMASPSHSLSWSKSFGLCLYKLRVTLSMACWSREHLLGMCCAVFNFDVVAQTSFAFAPIYSLKEKVANTLKVTVTIESSFALKKPVPAMGVIILFWTVFRCSFSILGNSHLLSVVCHICQSKSLYWSFFIQHQSWQRFICEINLLLDKANHFDTKQKFVIITGFMQVMENLKSHGI